MEPHLTWDVSYHMGSHSVTCHPTQVNTLRLNPSHIAGTRFTYPGGIEGWVDLVDLLHTEMVYQPADGHPPPSTKRAQCQLTTLIEANAPTTTLRCHAVSLQNFSTSINSSQSIRFTVKLLRSIYYKNRSVDIWSLIGQLPCSYAKKVSTGGGGLRRNLEPVPVCLTYVFIL